MIALLKYWWNLKVQRIKCALGEHTQAVATARVLDYELFEKLRLDSRWVCEFCGRELAASHHLVQDAKARIKVEMDKIEQNKAT